MTTDTGQPGMAPKNVALDEAANAFKMHLGQVPNPVARDDAGRFASTAPDDEIVEGEAEQAEPEADNDVEQNDEDGAADEAQPEPVEMPASWSKEDSETWNALPPEAQAKIAVREGQRDAAVNQKFQEAANLRKANQAVIEQADYSRQEALAVIDQVSSLIMPQKPSMTMLNPNSGDYNPDAYHYQTAEYEQSIETLQALTQQRQAIAAQHEAQMQHDRSARFQAIEEAARPALYAAVPDLQDPVKASSVISEVIDYAVSVGIPREVFVENANDITSAEILMAWKAKEYDRLQSAKTKVAATPKPTPRAAPSLRPGVPTPRSANEQTKLKGAYDRLNKSGSIEDGAAVLKQLFRG